MTNQEAIETIRCAIDEVSWDYPLNYAAAFEMAIEALEEKKINQWVSVEKDGLPPTRRIDFSDTGTNMVWNISDYVLVIFKSMWDDDMPFPEIARLKNGKWHIQGDWAGDIFDDEAVYWMKFPEPPEG